MIFCSWIISSHTATCSSAHWWLCCEENTCLCDLATSNQDAQCSHHHRKAPCATFQSILHLRSSLRSDSHHRSMVLHILEFQARRTVCTVWAFASDFFGSVYYFPDSSVLLCILQFIFLSLFFFLLNNIQFQIYQFVYPFFLSVDVPSFSSRRLSWVKSLWIFSDKVLRRFMPSFLFIKCLGVDFLGH